MILYSIASCDVKLFVAATPISGPQFNPITNDDSCESMSLDDLQLTKHLHLIL